MALDYLDEIFAVGIELALAYTGDQRELLQGARAVFHHLGQGGVVEYHVGWYALLGGDLTAAGAQGLP